MKTKKAPERNIKYIIQNIIFIVILHLYFNSEF